MPDTYPAKPYRVRQLLMRPAISGVVLIAGLFVVLGLTSWYELMPLPPTLNTALMTHTEPVTERAATVQNYRAQVLAANGTVLGVSYQNPLNITHTRTLSDIPQLIRNAFIVAEDRRYWRHGGVDWQGRLAAIAANIREGRTHRGASTIAEQAARILSPRPRTYWGHWMAGMDASRLIRRFGHAEVLQFYLNQIPYAANRRGVVQAAHYYFGRDLTTLNPAEQLALAVIVRSPARYDPWRQHQNLNRAIQNLAKRLHAQDMISADQKNAIMQSSVRPPPAQAVPDTSAFIAFARQQASLYGLYTPDIRTTLDLGLHSFVQQSLRHQVKALASQNIRDAAALVVDNQTGTILSWATAPGTSPHGIDPVLTPRQPGSTLKPFVYALAMERLGWQADHVLNDTPLSERIDTGVHHYRNYSNRYYGSVSLRYALGNSLNIPVIRTAQAVGVAEIIRLFRSLGVRSFNQGAAYYGAAIALGDGAISLYDLVQAYSALARHGSYLPLRVLSDQAVTTPVQVLPATVTSVLSNILSDPDARSAEFGSDSVLNLPYPTAIKTGTSSNYRDAWTVAYDNRYTVGVWMGRLDGGTNAGITGSSGPAPIVRQIFSRLRLDQPYSGLWLSPKLQKTDSCHYLGPSCRQQQEWYFPASSDKQQPASATGHPTVVQPHLTTSSHTNRAYITRPIDGETLAIDPRVPSEAQQLQLDIKTEGPASAIRRVIWHVNDEALNFNKHSSTTLPLVRTAYWQLQPGRHHIYADVFFQNQNEPVRTAGVNFQVLGGDQAVAGHAATHAKYPQAGPSTPAQ